MKTRFLHLVNRFSIAGLFLFSSFLFICRRTQVKWGDDFYSREEILRVPVDVRYVSECSCIFHQCQRQHICRSSQSKVKTSIGRKWGKKLRTCHYEICHWVIPTRAPLGMQYTLTMRGPAIKFILWSIHVFTFHHRENIGNQKFMVKLFHPAVRWLIFVLAYYLKDTTLLHSFLAAIRPYFSATNHWPVFIPPNMTCRYIKRGVDRYQICFTWATELGSRIALYGRTY